MGRNLFFLEQFEKVGGKLVNDCSFTWNFSDNVIISRVEERLVIFIKISCRPISKDKSIFIYKFSFWNTINIF